MQYTPTSDDIPQSIFDSINLVKQVTIFDLISSKKQNLMNQYREKNFSIPKPRSKTKSRFHAISKAAMIKQECIEKD